MIYMVWLAAILSILAEGDASEYQSCGKAKGKQAVQE
jgi:hypothetical protein